MKVAKGMNLINAINMCTRVHFACLAKYLK